MRGISQWRSKIREFPMLLWHPPRRSGSITRPRAMLPIARGARHAYVAKVVGTHTARTLDMDVSLRFILITAKFLWVKVLS